MLHTSVLALRCEYLTDPLGIDVPRPRLSWRLESARRGVRQVAYQVTAASTREGLEQPDLWNSGRVESADSAHIEWDGTVLGSGQQVHWNVRVWDDQGSECVGQAAHFSIGLLEPSDWSALWITADAGARRLPHLRRTFVVGEGLVRATLHCTALGLYDARCNGTRLGKEYLRPGWTDYRVRVPYQTLDLADVLRVGENVLGAVLADGWYAGFLGFGAYTGKGKARELYGEVPELRAQLALEYADGSTQTVATDADWRWSTGPLIESDLQMGEIYDAQRELGAWDTPGFDDSAWQPVQIGGGTSAMLVAQMTPGVQVLEELRPLTVTEAGPGTYLFDVGQNMVGWARLRVSAARGTELRLRFGEMLDEEGQLYTANLRRAKATDVYITRGDGVEEYEPTFTFHGFRYVEVAGWPGAAPSADAITGIVVANALTETGSIVTSNPMVNQLQSNIRWGQRGNFLEVPTDCPQRDERLGWLGDVGVFGATASYNADVASFLTKWMDDVADGQSDDGAFPDVAPRLPEVGEGSPGWGDAGVIVPWTIYQRYGDRRILAKSFAGATRWVDYIARVNPDNLWVEQRGSDFGDWLSVDAETPKELLATAYFAYSASLAAKMASVLGERTEAARLSALAVGIRSAFARTFLSDGVLSDESQTGYALALQFDLVPSADRATAAQRLVDDIHQRGGHLSTGFLGVAALLPALTDNGHLDLAYQLLQNESYPSWGFTIAHGATTIWERWDGWTPDRGFQTTMMNSFNHYCFGSVGHWLFTTVGGVEVDFSRQADEVITIKPRPGGGLTSVDAGYDSILGRVGCAWEATGRGLSMRVQVPANTRAKVHVPTVDSSSVTEGCQPLQRGGPVLVLASTPQEVVLSVPSGTYEFAAL